MAIRAIVPNINASSRFPFHWDFTEPTDDHQQAVHNAIRTFLSGLTIEEKRAARNSLDVVAHPTYLPPAPLPIRWTPQVAVNPSTTAVFEGPSTLTGPSFCTTANERV